MIKAVLSGVFAVLAAPAIAACATGDGDWINAVCFAGAGDAAVYGHAILGDTPEWSTITVAYGQSANAAPATVSFPNSIFEDVAPRLIDVDGDGRPEAIVVQSDYQQGARIVILTFDPAPRVLAATPFIGQRNRWFAPVGAADFDGDGTIEIAYVDRPHLAKALRIWRYDNGDFYEVAVLPDITNHRIGEADIAGGVRDCGRGPEMIVASSDWDRVVAVRMIGDRPVPTDIGLNRGHASFAAALACE